MRFSFISTLIFLSACTPMQINFDNQDFKHKKCAIVIGGCHEASSTGTFMAFTHEKTTSCTATFKSKDSSFTVKDQFYADCVKPGTYEFVAFRGAEFSYIKLPQNTSPILEPITIKAGEAIYIGNIYIDTKISRILNSAISIENNYEEATRLAKEHFPYIKTLESNLLHLSLHTQNIKKIFKTTNSTN